MPAHEILDFLDGRDSPELVTMAEALCSFSVYFNLERINERAIATLGEWFDTYDISADGADMISEFMFSLDEANTHYERNVGTDHIDVNRWIQEKERAEGRSRRDLRTAFDSNDARTLARELSIPLEQMRGKLRFNYNPWERYLVAEMPGLRDGLRRSDWDGLRTLLFEKVATGYSVISQED